MRTYCLLGLIFTGNVAALGGSLEECLGPGDLNRDFKVDLVDFEQLARCMAGPSLSMPPVGCTGGEFTGADLNDDIDVDMLDYVRFLEFFDNQYFDYGPFREDLEAEMLAMDVSGELRAPDAEYERILSDLQDIRAMFPELDMVIDDPDYEPNQLIVDLREDVPTDDYVGLNMFYLVTNEEILFGTTRVLTFCGNLNAIALAQEYGMLAEVNFAEPNSFIGHDDQIQVSPQGDVYTYFIDDGFLDCFDGCDCHRLWEIEVDSLGNVSLISYSEQGQPWCEF